MRYLTHDMAENVFKTLKPNTKVGDGELEDNPV